MNCFIFLPYLSIYQVGNKFFQYYWPENNIQNRKYRMGHKILAQRRVFIVRYYQQLIDFFLIDIPQENEILGKYDLEPTQNIEPTITLSPIEVLAEPTPAKTPVLGSASKNVLGTYGCNCKILLFFTHFF